MKLSQRRLIPSSEGGNLDVCIFGMLESLAIARPLPIYSLHRALSKTLGTPQYIHPHAPPVPYRLVP